MADPGALSTLPNLRTAESSKSTPSPTHSPHSSPDTTMTTPEQSPGADDDIWDTSSDHEHATDAAPGGFASEAQLPTDASGQEHPPTASRRIVRREVILSDVPSLRRQHMTDGYREGLSVGKARVMQRGFDAGYPLGVEVGLRVGQVLGVLEGVVSALTTKPRSGGKMADAGSSSSTVPTVTTPSLPRRIEEPLHGVVGRDEPQGSISRGKRDEDLAFVQNLYARAQRQLKISELLKFMDDEKIAAIPDASVGIDGGGGSGEVESKQAEGPAVPAEIEAVLEKWEQIVLGGLRKDDSKAQEDTNNSTK
ncbi:uncharacterized protein PV07_01817 [Cladophialophora immunda]|uniref:Protein YAE1 n=1 Tax=Cladophialophora immunda TaxID=569365 RepID=A0A0D2DH69_9EURO|nr:uncharacterized protein PV07_01817 [Cladophialophora immunda]KIW35099.1 hypothetical protein PV07_01817 [Cladophialophora immunda]